MKFETKDQVTAARLHIVELQEAIRDFERRTRDFEVGKKYRWQDNQLPHTCVFVGAKQGIFTFDRDIGTSAEGTLYTVHKDHLWRHNFLPV